MDILSPEGNILASGSQDHTIKLWKLDTGELLCTLGEQPGKTSPASGAISVAISPDGQTLASCGTNSRQLWNLCTGELLQTLSGRCCVAFSPDGQTLVSGGEGRIIKIWRPISGADQSTLDPILLTKEWYSVLGVDRDTHPDHVKRAYLRLARQYHPDVNASASAKATMQAVNAAYQEFQQKFNKA